VILKFIENTNHSTNKALEFIYYQRSIWVLIAIQCLAKEATASQGTKTKALHVL